MGGETGNKYWRKCEDTVTLVHCWWGCKMVQVLRKTVWLFFKTLNKELLYNPAIPASKAGSWRDICMPVCQKVEATQASFDIWKNKQNVYTNEKLLSLKKEIPSHATTWKALSTITEFSEMMQSQKDKYCMVPLRWGSRSKQSGGCLGLDRSSEKLLFNGCRVVKLHEEKLWRPVSQQRDILDHLCTIKYYVGQFCVFITIKRSNVPSYLEKISDINSSIHVLLYPQAVKRTSWTINKGFAKDAWLTLPQLKTLWSNRRPDDKVVGFKERVGELTQFTGPVDPGPQRHRFLLQLQLTSDQERKLPLNQLTYGNHY